MLTLKIVLHKPEEKRGGTSGPGNPPPELAVIQQEKELLRPLLEQMQKINETLMKVESVLISWQKQISETTRKADLMLISLGEKEEKEDLSFTLTNDLAPLTGSEANELKEEVDMAPKAYSTYIKENTLPEEGDAELSRKYIRDLISFVVSMEPAKIDGRKYKKKKKREKMESILKATKLLKRHASMEEAALKTGINASSEEDSSPGERSDGAGAIKIKRTQLLLEET